MDSTDQAWAAAAAVGTPKKPPKQARPFGLTARQCEAVSLFVKCEAVSLFVKCVSVKKVSAQLGISHEETCRIIQRARERMGVANNVQLALKWDQHVRAEHVFTSSRTRSVFALGGQQ